MNKLVDVAEIEKLQQFAMIDQTGFVEQSNHGDYVHIDDLRALLDRSPTVSEASPLAGFDKEGIELSLEWLKQQDLTVNVGNNRGMGEELLESSAGYLLRLIQTMLEASPPVEIMPRLNVHVYHMKESNGNQWWSVVLTKGEAAKIWDGYEVYQSKVEGRANYEADRLRHFLGLTDKSPSILDYDTDMPQSPLVEAEPVGELIVDSQRYFSYRWIKELPCGNHLLYTSPPDTEAKLKRAVEALRDVKIMLPTIANALAIADAVADNVPTKAQELPDSPISRIGKLINMPDLTNSPDLLLKGYQEIQLGINALREISQALKDIGEIK